MSGKRFWTSKEARAAGWYSRRHETRDAQDEARERYQAKPGRRGQRPNRVPRPKRKTGEAA